MSYSMDVALLQHAGHEVEAIEESNERINEIGSLRTAARTIWSQNMYSKVRKVLRHNSFDVLHVQNSFPLISPSVYYAARAEGVAVVQTLRNYRLLCPGVNFLRDGKVCELCLGKAIPWPSVRYGCYRHSSTATSVVAAMLALHRAGRTWTSCVDRYIALTQFGRDKFVQGGLPAKKLAVRPNFVYPDPGLGVGGGRFAVFVGRLDEQKGVATLLSAWHSLNGVLPIKIVGDGPLATVVKEAAGCDPSIKWLGQQNSAETLGLIGRADVLVFCSQSYEGQPRVIIEALAKGTPVIAPKLGAAAEMIDEGITGWFFRVGDSESLARTVCAAINQKHSLARMRTAARDVFEQKFAPSRSLKLLLEIYQSAIEHAQAHNLTRIGGKRGSAGVSRKNSTTPQ